MCETKMVDRHSILHNFYVYVDAMCNDDCTIMYSGAHDVSEMFQQAVPYTYLGDMHKGASPKTDVTSTNRGAGLVVPDTILQSRL